MIKSLVIRKQTSQIYFLIVKHLDRTFFVRQFLSMIKVTFFQRPQNCFTFLWKYSSEISMTKRYLNLSIMHSHHNGSRSIWWKKTWPLVFNNFINSRAIFSPTPVFLFFVPFFFRSTKVTSSYKVHFFLFPLSYCTKIYTLCHHDSGRLIINEEKKSPRQTASWCR